MSAGANRYSVILDLMNTKNCENTKIQLPHPPPSFLLLSAHSSTLFYPIGPISQGTGEKVYSVLNKTAISVGGGESRHLIINSKVSNWKKERKKERKRAKSAGRDDVIKLRKCLPMLKMSFLRPPLIVVNYPIRSDCGTKAWPNRRSIESCRLVSHHLLLFHSILQTQQHQQQYTNEIL